MLLKIVIHILIIVFLTIITQIGGIVYLGTIILINPKVTNRKFKKIGLFTSLYFFATFILVPNIAPFFGREKIVDTEFIEAHSFFYKLANRNYVRPELQNVIRKVASQFGKRNEGVKMIYLDANFPFIDGFSLLPHLSHNDGKKIDVSLVYETYDGKLTNKKPSITGYGVYEAPKEREFNQTADCKRKGNWQYDFTKYFTLGRINRDIKFSNKGTGELMKLILKQSRIGKLFLEPHLKNRLHLRSSKIRFHGCKAVRHDDHIHFQLK